MNKENIEPNSSQAATDDFFENNGIRVLTSIRKIIRAVDIHSRKLNNEYNTTAPQMICLYSLQKGGRITQSELAKQVSMGMSTINGVIDRLEKK
ncbi:MAG: MarR family transcriptional regulator, partial [Proteobacteria bacterium]|nr:MarR family transcriptional regulator [Pseudomonadota bacterium]